MNQDRHVPQQPAEVAPPSASSLKDKTLNGLIWSALGRVSQQGLSILVSIVLSRLLLPEAFGLVAMLAVFIGFASIFADSGLGAALIQRSEINHHHIETSLTLNLSIGLLLTALLYVGSPVLAGFYGAPHLEPMGKALSTSFVLSSLGIVPRALITRQFHFHLLARIDVIASGVSGIVAIVLALQGAGVWSLVALTLVLELVRTPLLWLWCDWRIRLGFRLLEARELFGFSIGLLGFNSINYWSRNADNLLIGKFIGAGSLGLYSRAYTLMMLPISQINSVLSSVMFPVFSSIKDQPDRIAKAYVRAIGMVAFLAFPIALGMFAIADPLIPLLYGEQWSDAVGIFRILCWVSLVQVMANPTGWIFTSLGKTRLMFGWGVVSSIVIVVSIAIGTSFRSIDAVAWWYLAANCVLLFPLYTLIGRMISLGWRQVFGAAYRPLISSLCMSLLVYLAGQGLPTSWPDWLTLLAQIVVGVVVYLAATIIIQVEAYEEAYTAVSLRLGSYRDHWLWKLLAPVSITYKGH